MSDKYSKLTPSMILDLAAPHTWTASIFPVLLAISAAIATGHEVSMALSLVLLLISVLLQSSVNAINDYFDYVKGTDSEDDNVEEYDSVLVYNNVNPRSVLACSMAFIVISLALGCICIYVSGPYCLLPAAIGIACVVLYSAGRTPISYLPIGEVISGFVMGGLITYASFNVMTRDLSPWILLVSIPLILNIALIMLTNNASDIEKDVQADRRTLPVLIGRDRSRILYRSLMVLSYLSMLVICAIWFPQGTFLYPVLFLVSLPFAMRLWNSSLEPASRAFSMSQICGFNTSTGSMYCMMILISAASVSL